MNRQRQDIFSFFLSQHKLTVELKYISKDLKNYETYIVGNFYILFNMSNIIKEINDKLLILQNANIQILSDKEDVVCEKYILYSKFDYLSTRIAARLGKFRNEVRQSW